MFGDFHPALAVVLSVPALILVGVAAVALIVSVADLIVIRRSRGAPLPIGALTRATDLLPLVLGQVVVAALVNVIPITSSNTANMVIGLTFSAGVLILAGINICYGLANWQRERRGVVAAPPPVLALPPGYGPGVYRCVATPPPSERSSKVAFLLLTFVGACYLVPGALALVGGLDIIDALLLIVGAIGMGFFLSGLVTLDQRRILVADDGQLHLRLGLMRRSIPWAEVRELRVRDHGDGRWSYQLVGASRIIMWFERPQARRGTISTSALAAVAQQRGGVSPTFLNPQETNAVIRRAIDATSTKVAERATKMMG